MQSKFTHPDQPLNLIDKSKTVNSTQTQRFLLRGYCPFECPPGSCMLFLLFTIDLQGSSFTYLNGWSRQLTGPREIDGDANSKVITFAQAV